MISCRDWWPWTKPGSITITRRQSNNQWSGGVAAHPAPKNSECKNPLEKFSPHWLCSKGPNYQRGVLLISAGANEGHFEGKMLQEVSPRGSCSCTTMPWVTGHLQPRRNWPNWASNVLITHPILWIWPCQTNTCSLDWKKQLKVCHFSSNMEVIAAAETWLDRQTSEFFFFEWLAKVRATG